MGATTSSSTKTAEDSGSLEVVDRVFLRNLFSSLTFTNMPDLPLEIQTRISDYVLAAQPDESDSMDITPVMSDPALIPSLNSSATFMDLPSELRREMLAASLLARDVVYRPHCKDDRYPQRPKTEPGKQPRHNRLSDLMILNRRIHAEVAEVVYEERSFVIHVHEGLRDGGIEFLDTGRQPLQYKDVVEDPRFSRFGQDDETGFARLKKIVVEIIPTPEVFSRHIAVNTYFMNLALCNLMERHRGRSDRIKSLTIRFTQPPGTEHYWWDPDKRKPRETSVHNLSNIELVLRPFASLIGCHSVSIELPAGMRNHQPTVAFADALKSSMLSTDSPSLMDDQLRFKIEGARAAMDDFVTYTLHGKQHHYVAPLTEEEMFEEEEIGFAEAKGKKRVFSPNSKEQGSGPKRQARSSRAGSTAGNPVDLDEDLNKFQDESRALQASHDSLAEDEERMVMAAIQASLRDLGQSGQYPTIASSSRSHVQDTPTPWPSKSATVMKDLAFRGKGCTLSSWEKGNANATGSSQDRQLPIRLGRTGTTSPRASSRSPSPRTSSQFPADMDDDEADGGVVYDSACELSTQTAASGGPSVQPGGSNLSTVWDAAEDYMMVDRLAGFGEEENNGVSAGADEDDGGQGTADEGEDQAATRASRSGELAVVLSR